MDLTEFLGEFQLEAGEKLDILAGQLLRLERDPTNPSPIREMFLAAHTIKGGAAMLRLTDIEALAHGVEDLLSSLREQQRTLDATAADLLFQSIDRLRELVDTSSADAFGAEVDARVLSFADELRANATGFLRLLPPRRPSPSPSRTRLELPSRRAGSRELCSSTTRRPYVSSIACCSKMLVSRPKPARTARPRSRAHWPSRLT